MITDFQIFYVGTWRSFLVADSDNFIKIPKTIRAETASCLFGAPLVALRLMNDFASLHPGMNEVISRKYKT